MFGIGIYNNGNIRVSGTIQISFEPPEVFD